MPWNKRSITYSGKTQSIRAWAKELNMPYQTLYYRLFISGWSIEEALLVKAGVVRLAQFTPKLINYQGKTQSIGAWAKEININYGTLRARVRIGWDTPAMLTKMVAKKSPTPQGVQLTRISTSAYVVWRGDECLGTVRKVGTHRWIHTRSWEAWQTRAKAILSLLDSS